MVDQKVNELTQEILSALVDGHASEIELQRILKQSDEDSEVRATWGRYLLIGAAMRGELSRDHSLDLAAQVRASIENEPCHQGESWQVADDQGQDKVQKNQVSAISQVLASPPWWQTVSRLAIAASVAAVVVLGVQQYSPLLSVAGKNNEMTSASTPDTPHSVNSFPAGFNAPSLPARTVSTADQRSRVNSQIDSSPQVFFVPDLNRKSTTKSKTVVAPRALSNISLSNKTLEQYLNQLMIEHAEHASLNSGRGMLPFARVARMEDATRSK